ncbi:hypothetical protein [Bdellovibrio sp. HCB-110]|uniref:hypothetical protein n=1 Tax=Bdellovibrio sp. HCB-110 TaxID=3391182 RepID=UPI0039B3FF63
MIAMICSERIGFPSLFKNLICFCAVSILNISCTMDATLKDLTSPSQIETLKFDETFLDVSALHPKVFSMDFTSSGELQVNLSMEEYIYKNKVKFVNVPDGASLQCSGASSNLALQSLDLDGAKSFSMKLNYWVPTLQEWSDIENQSFSCWYEIAGGKSQVITFKVTLKESDIIRVSVPNYAGTEVKGRSEGGKISGDGRFVVYTSSQEDFAAEDDNGEDDVFAKDLSTGKVYIVSKSSAGQVGNRDSDGGSISFDGRYVAFTSSSTNLVSGDTNNSTDVYVHDRQTGITTRVSVDSSGAQGNGSSYDPSLSSDGRYVVFTSGSTNLVSGDTNAMQDIFVHDRQTGVTTRVSLDSSGVQGDGNSYDASLSSDGRYVAFYSSSTNLVAGDSNSKDDIFVHDLQTGVTTRVSVDSFGAQGNGHSYFASLSSDGRYVTFYSGAANLVTGDTNADADVFIHDRQTGVTTRVSVDSSGAQANGPSYYPVLSSDGRYVAFYSSSTNLVAGDTNAVYDIFVHDRQTGATNRVSVDNAGVQGDSNSMFPSLSSDGRYVVFDSIASNFVSGDTNLHEDVFIHDREMGVTGRVSLDSSGGEASEAAYKPALNADGRFVVFQSYDSSLVPGDMNGDGDIFIHDRQSGVTSLISVNISGTSGSSESYAPAVSADGRYVAFQSSATDLIAGDTNGFWDIFVRDRQTGVTSRISVDSAGVQSNGNSYAPSLSADGRYVVFESKATNLVAGDTNNSTDIFVHDCQTGTTTRVSVDSSGTQGDSYSETASISGDGRYIAFESGASNLVVGDTNANQDIFVHDRQTGLTSRVSVDSSDVQGNDHSYTASLNSDGRYIAFRSSASNLVTGDTNGQDDVFVHDLQGGITSRVSVDSSGMQGSLYSGTPSINGDGRYVAFESNSTNLVSGDTNAQTDVFVHDRQTGNTSRVSVNRSGVEGNWYSATACISSDGRYIAFESEADNLVSGDFNWNYDIFVRKNK